MVVGFMPDSLSLTTHESPYPSRIQVLTFPVAVMLAVNPFRSGSNGFASFIGVNPNRFDSCCGHCPHRLVRLPDWGFDVDWMTRGLWFFPYGSRVRLPPTSEAVERRPDIIENPVGGGSLKNHVPKSISLGAYIHTLSRQPIAGARNVAAAISVVRFIGGQMVRLHPPARNHRKENHYGHHQCER